jgi:hypothetical protein
MTTFARCRQALLGVALLSTFCGAQAADAKWNTNERREFHDPFAWLNFAIPGASDRAVFAAPFSGYTVSFGDSASTAGILVSDSATTFDLSFMDYFVDGFTDVSDGGHLTVRTGLMLLSNSVNVGGGPALSALTISTDATISGPAVFIGRSGPGLVTVGRSGRLETGLVQAGYSGSNQGRLLVDGGVADTQRAYFGGSETCVPFCNVGVGPGTLDVINGGTFTTQVLLLAKNGNAVVNVNGGSLTAASITIAQLGNGSITVQSGGSLRAGSIGIEAAEPPPFSPGSGSVSVLAGGTVQTDSMQVGPANYSSLSTVSAPRTLTVSGNDANLIVNGGLAVKGGGSKMEISQNGFVRSNSALVTGSKDVAAEVIILSGGHWQNRGPLEIGKFLQSGSRLTIDGGRLDTESMYFIASTSCVPFCNVVPRSDLVVRNGGMLNAGPFLGGRLGPGAIRVESGGSVTSAQLDLGGGFNPFETIVTGTGSTWINDGTTNLGIGGAQAAATMLLQIDDGGLFRTSGALNTTSLATVRVMNGTLDVGSFGSLAGVLDFQSGHVITHSDLAIQPGAPLGTNLLLESNRSVSVLATTTLAPGQSLTVNGGRFATHSLQNLGTFSFISGVFAMTSDPFDIGPGGLIGSAVALTDSRRLEVTNQLNIASSGIVNVSGDALTAGTVNNQGQVQLNGGVSRITTPNFANNGRLVGGGAIQGSINNDKEGQIRVLSGQELDVAGNLNNSGQVFVLGGTLQVGESLDNAQNGFVSGRGVLATGRVKNVGSMAFSGTTDLIGDVENEKDGIIVISGRSTLTFYDDVKHNGAEIRASTGNNAVFFGSVQGEAGSPAVATSSSKAICAPATAPAS